MKLYVIIHSVEHEFDELLGIFDSKEVAQAEAATWANENGFRYDPKDFGWHNGSEHVTVNEHELNRLCVD